MKKRLISAFIALLISVPIVYFGNLPFYLFAIVLSLLGFTEILNLIVKDNLLVKLISYTSLLTLVGSNLLKNNFDNLIDYKIIGIIFLLYSLVMLYNYKNKNFDIPKCFYLMGITLFLGTAFSILIITRNINIYYFIYLFSITIFTDTFAHATGTLFGKHKINKISPNKSWEGCLGGTLFGTIISVLLYLFFINENINIFLIIIITLTLSIIGQLGDLFFSQIKRHYKIKDFSNIMPGHGGILDRLDSIIFVMFAFTYFITFL